jgi:hypothetical protein
MEVSAYIENLLKKQDNRRNFLKGLAKGIGIASISLPSLIEAAWCNYQNHQNYNNHGNYTDHSNYSNHSNYGVHTDYGDHTNGNVHCDWHGQWDNSQASGQFCGWADSFWPNNWGEWKPGCTPEWMNYNNYNNFCWRQSFAEEWYNYFGLWQDSGGWVDDGGWIDSGGWTNDGRWGNAGGWTNQVV